MDGDRQSSLELFRLDGLVALVTGGSQGLGLGMALALAEAGADVAVAARHAESLEETAEQIRALGRRALALPGDLRDLDVARAAVEGTAGALGRLDILVTAAASQLRKPILDVQPEEWDHLVSINLRSVYFLCQYAARRMMHQEPARDGGKRGKIINLASLTSVTAWPNVSVYGMTKGGVMQMTKAMALEWAPLEICVNAIGPGTFHTPLTEPLYSDPERASRLIDRIPMKRPGVAGDLAGAVVYLASPASDYVTGQVHWVDGGWLLMGAG